MPGKKTKKTTTTMNKPPYRDDDYEPSNGFVVASTFSGCGGSSLGYKLAGFTVAYANEFVEAAWDNYRVNFPDTYVDPRNIREVTPESILERIELARGELDILDGSPPCASFSSAGKRDKGWGEVRKYSDTEQRTDDLFGEFVRLIDGLQPKVFVAENVAGLIKGTAKGYFLRILRDMKACGYRVRAKLLEAQWLGVPQKRQRLIFVGVREDLGKDPVFPKPLPYCYGVKDVCPWIEAVGGIRETGFSGRSLVPSSEPCPTIMAGGGGGMNTSQFGCVVGGVKRRFEISEIKRLCSFPSSFVLTGSYSQQWERVGRAVPPRMMKAIASAILEGVLQ